MKGFWAFNGSLGETLNSCVLATEQNRTEFVIPTIRYTQFRNDSGLCDKFDLFCVQTGRILGKFKGKKSKIHALTSIYDQNS